MCPLFMFYTDFDSFLRIHVLVKLGRVAWKHMLGNSQYLKGHNFD